MYPDTWVTTFPPLLREVFECPWRDRFRDGERFFVLWLAFWEGEDMRRAFFGAVFGISRKNAGCRFFNSLTKIEGLEAPCRTRLRVVLCATHTRFAPSSGSTRRSSFTCKPGQAERGPRATRASFLFLQRGLAASQEAPQAQRRPARRSGERGCHSGPASSRRNPQRHDLEKRVHASHHEPGGRSQHETKFPIAYQGPQTGWREPPRVAKESRSGRRPRMFFDRPRARAVPGAKAQKIPIPVQTPRPVPCLPPAPAATKKTVMTRTAAIRAPQARSRSSAPWVQNGFPSGLRPRACQR